MVSPPTQYNNPDLDYWLRGLWSELLNIPASDVPPSSSSDVGTKGQMAYDNNYLYLCINENSWKRITLTAF